MAICEKANFLLCLKTLFSGSDNGSRQRELRPQVGSTGVTVSNGRRINEMISPPTPISHSKTPHSSVHSSPQLNLQRKSRPPSTMTSPVSIDEISKNK